MIQEILAVTSTWWLLIVAAACLVCLALPLSRLIISRGQVNREVMRLLAVRQSVDGLAACRIDNLPKVEAIISRAMPEQAAAVKLLHQDSTDVFRGHWIPEPDSRLPYPDACAPSAQAAIRQRPSAEAFLAGLILSITVLALAIVDADTFGLKTPVIILALVPFIMGLLSAWLLQDQRNRLDTHLARAHRQLMLAIARKVPVFTQAGETAAILSRYTDHDSHMLESVRQLTGRVDRMASGEITDAITNSIKFLLSATIGPPLQRSSEALTQLAFQLEKNMTTSLNTLGDRLVALEFQQTESAKFLQNQYETVTSTLLQQQEMSFKQLGAVQSLMLEQIRDQQQQTLSLMTSNQQQTLTALTEGQQLSYRSISIEQQQSIQKMLVGFQEAMGHLVAMNQESQTAMSGQYQKAWSELQGGLSLTISSLVAGQEKLNSEWQTAIASLSTALRDGQDGLVTTLQANQVSLLSDITARQEQMTSATLKLTQELSTTLQEKLALLTDSLAAQQTQVTDTLVGHQARILESLTGQQTTLSEALLAQQATVSESLLTQHGAISEKLVAQQAQFDSSWKAWSQALADQQAQIASVMAATQNDMAAANSSLTQKVTGALLSQQEALGEDLRNRTDEFARSLQSQQVELAKTMQSQQVELASTMQGRQDELLKAFQTRQEELVATLRTSQETLYAATNELQERLHGAFQKQQLAAIAQMQNAQDQTLQKVADYHQASLDSMTDDVARNLGSYLDKYLEPVSARLIASADVLVAAQAYADKVQDAFELQREQVAIVEAGMKDAIQAFVETRTTMAKDLTDLRASSSIMSTSADRMSAIFSGSESGLSDSISELAGTMKVLKESLEQITSGAVQNTKYLQEQIEQSHLLNQRQITDLAAQITNFSDELATRIEQLTLGFTGITDDLVKSVRSSLNEQNEAFSGSVRHLVDVLAEESRSMSLFAQEINSDIENLSSTLGTSVSSFNTEIRSGLENVLERFDLDVSEVLKRLMHATSELGDAVDALPEALSPVRRM